MDQQHGLLGGRLSRVEGGQQMVGTWGTNSGMGIVGEAVCPRHSRMLCLEGGVDGEELFAVAGE